MTRCDLDVVLYFYDEMDAVERARATAHLRSCPSCRATLDELYAIRQALSAQPAVDAPPAGDWSGFTRRLDAAVAAGPALRVEAAPRNVRWQVRRIVAVAAMVALVTMGVAVTARYRATVKPAAVAAGVEQTPPPQLTGMGVAAPPASSEAAGVLPERSLRAVSAEHLERSKLVVLGLATRDPRHTTEADWQYERRLAGSLLSDTRLYRLAAQDRGVTDVARVMRDLETVLLEASMSDSSDKEALPRVQRLIARRDLVVKMQVVAGSSGL